MSSAISRSCSSRAGRAGAAWARRLAILCVAAATSPAYASPSALRGLGTNMRGSTVWCMPRRLGRGWPGLPLGIVLVLVQDVGGAVIAQDWRGAATRAPQLIDELLSFGTGLLHARRRRGDGQRQRVHARGDV